MSNKSDKTKIYFTSYIFIYSFFSLSFWLRLSLLHVQYKNPMCYDYYSSSFLFLCPFHGHASKLVTSPTLVLQPAFCFHFFLLFYFEVKHYTNSLIFCLLIINHPSYSPIHLCLMI
ncbi:hypothetical protein V8G54_019595 [Vigna mungo]|uniref:Uncharacterized protein n=1 Tax=Vigna mungo TaxID=3915 RepID=A0AAQ3RSJ8_VIGMU